MESSTNFSCSSEMVRLSCPVRPVLSRTVMDCPVLSCPVLYFVVLSCHFLYCNVVSSNKLQLLLKILEVCLFTPWKLKVQSIQQQFTRVQKSQLCLHLADWSLQQIVGRHKLVTILYTLYTVHFTSYNTVYTLHCAFH